jgi:manganese efflux pump family protein
MSLFEIILVALALAADAFTVSLAVGLRHRRPRQVFRLSFHFGLFQALFPLVGACLGFLLGGWIGSWTHWVSFGLLLFIGGRMLFEALFKKEARTKADLTKGFHLVGLSVAVSIDALAVGFTLGLRDVSIVLAVTIIGVVTWGLTLIGMRLAGKLPAALGRRMEALAGLVLIGLGIKMLLENSGGIF